MAIVRRCPKCGGIPNEYREVWTDHGIAFDADDGGMPAAVGYTYDGVPRYVVASCRECGWAWRLRGIQQITEVRGE